ncbi:hypothetical protein VTO42DRAFT_5070 [Malbranchea cinnamomea]
MDSNGTDMPVRPMGPRTVKSFSRLESPTSGLFSRSRSKTVQDVSIPEITATSSVSLSYGQEDSEDGTDVFERSESVGHENDNEEFEPSLLRPENHPERFDELPIELMSLTDRFVESLSAKVYPTPPTIDDLSQLFQDFYIRASSHISTHVSTLVSRLNRGHSPSPSRSQTAPRPKRVFSSSACLQSSEKGESTAGPKEQQMLTVKEVAEKRRARKLLQYKQHVLEEAVERRVCEAVYDKIWRHRSTLDEVRDEKLRSRTAALSLVGIKMKDLGVNLPTSREGLTTDVSSLLADARDSIMKMNAERYPLGKLQHLIAAHKAIVDTLTKLFPSSSSADEILPTLIYTLLTSPQDVNIISNLLFIQRFRAANKIDGEAAYCLTNLEAAISFLENVDMATLGVNDLPKDASVLAKEELTRMDPVSIGDSGPLSKPLTISQGSSDSAPPEKQTPSPRPPEPTLSPQQRLTSFFQPPAKAIGAANDIVRNTADQGLKNISNTLDNSFKFLFGRLKEVQISQGGNVDETVGIVPKTLDDARRLVNPSGLPGDTNSVSELAPSKNRASTVRSLSPRPKLDDRLAEVVGGRRPNGDRNTVGTKPASDAKKAPSDKFAGQGSTTSPPISNTAFDSVKNFGNTLNPLNRIPGVIRGFGRNTTDQPAQSAVVSPTSTPDEKAKPAPVLRGKKSSDLLKETSNVSTAKIAPPIKRFLEMEDPAELKIGDIPELLQDYKRLASVLSSLEMT